MITFQQFIKKLISFWETQGCAIHQGYDLEVGAGTFNPATFLRCLGPEPYRAAYIEPCRRPSDGRYGTNPNRLQHYFQFQVIIKPSPLNMQELYLKSLEAVGFDLSQHDIRFVHDDWENPTIGAWGLGWEVWMDGMEITQFTYFQSVGGVNLKPITAEITYGIERLAMYLQKVNSVYELKWNDHLTYGDIFHQNEVEWSHYNFEEANTEMWMRHFEDYEKESTKLIAKDLPIPAYDFVMKASHAFNMLDARGVISVTERTGYIGRIRDLARQIAESYMKSREKQGFPLLQSFPSPQHSSANNPTKIISNSFEEPFSTEKGDFLLEIGSEELPASFVTIGGQNLSKQIRLLLEKEGISFESIKVLSTPRRLSVYVSQIAKGTASRSIEKKGPPLSQVYEQDGSLTATGEGFFRSIALKAPTYQDVKSGLIKEVEVRLIKDIPYLIGKIEEKSKATISILHEHLPALILNLDFPKKMHWSNLDITYARPLHWIVALMDNTVIPLQVGPITAGRITYGHRLLSPNEHSLNNAQSYIESLRSLHVLADPEERKQCIINQIDQIEIDQHAVALAKEKVAEQVLNLVEWPFLTTATFDPRFLKAPQEVLVSEMVEHQKYFPVSDKTTGVLKNLFIITANTPPSEQIKEGNQRVLSARLSDGVFLYEEDLKISIDVFNEKLKKIIFQKDLGSVFEKEERIAKHAGIIQKLLQIGDLQTVQRAGHVCKFDLASHMVHEFPELQGVIGAYYAKAQHEDKEVVAAIEEHWMPKGENSPLPKTDTGTIVSIADKFDNLIGCFAIGFKPTSSSDPYALRRQVIGIIKMLINGKHHFDLQKSLIDCASHFPSNLKFDPGTIANEIMLFITNRLRAVLVDDGFYKDEIEACLQSGCNDIYAIYCRLQALHTFRQQSKEQFLSFHEVYKRAKGQLGEILPSQINEQLLLESSEKLLNETLNRQEPLITDAIKNHRYTEAYELLANIQPEIANLFESVKIMADDLKIRNNRLALLKRTLDLFDQLLDLSKIQVNS